MTKTAIATADGSDPEWMSTAAAARLLGITPRLLYRLVDSGQLPAHRFGRVIRLQREHVQQYRDRSI